MAHFIPHKSRKHKPISKSMKTLQQVILDLRAADADSTAANDIQAFLDANPTVPVFDVASVTLANTNGTTKVAPFSAFV